MAIFHLSVKVISRNQGRTAVAAAAYRAGERLTNENTGLTHDFTPKAHDVVNKVILSPYEAPEWVQSRAKLWNEVEKSEKRINSRTAREIEISLPRELTNEQNWSLLCDFVNKRFVQLHGMIADVAFHKGHKNKEGQPHAHIMLTTREITKDGFGVKRRDWNAKSLLLEWREDWATHCNNKLKELDMGISIDHRTLKAQGINLEPQSKIGSPSLKKNAARVENHRRIARENGNRILGNPHIALDALTKMQSTFTDDELQKFIFRHSDSNEQFQSILLKIRAHSELVILDQSNNGNDRYTTKSMLTLEQNMIDQAILKSAETHHQLSIQQAKKTSGYASLSSEQQDALTYITTNNDLSCIVGYAGTGKSYLMNTAREVWEKAGYHVCGMTLSGIAADNLAAESGIESHTIASMQLYWQHDKKRLDKNTIVVVDESGMISSRQLSAILEEATQAKAKVVLIGDPEQLQSIEAGAAYRAIAERVGFVAMTNIRRQQEAWQQEATRQLAQCKTTEALNAYARHDLVHAHTTTADALNAMVSAWEEVRSNHPNETQLMLAYRRDQVDQLNHHARQIKIENGELGQSCEFETTRGKRTFAIGDRVYFLKNDNQDLKVKNGSIGTILEIDHDHLTIQVDARAGNPTAKITFSIKDYNALEYGYAATIHKAQGTTVDRTYVYASKSFDRHAAYVALSRHRKSVAIHYAKDNIYGFDGLCKLLSRSRHKDITLDYLGNDQKLSLQRLGIDSSNIKKAKDTCLSWGMTEKEAEAYIQKGIKNIERVQDVIKAMKPLAERYKTTKADAEKVNIVNRLDMLANTYIDDIVVMRQLKIYDLELYHYVKARGKSLNKKNIMKITS